MLKCLTVYVEFPLSWKKVLNFFTGVVIPSSKIRNCEKCAIDKMCEECKLKTKQILKLSANLNKLKKQPAINFGQVLTKSIGKEFLYLLHTLTL